MNNTTKLYRDLKKANEIISSGFYCNRNVCVRGGFYSVSVGLWDIDLGGYDTGYVVSYYEIECIAVDYENKTKKWIIAEPYGLELDKDKVEQILGCSKYTEIK